MRRAGVTLFLILALWQIAAIFASLHGWLQLHFILAIPTACFLGAFPVIGAAFAAYGATQVWNWPWWFAALAFFGPVAVAAALVAIPHLRNRREYE
jgi:hypothetical protein